MKNDATVSEPGRRYATAYEAHYTTKDLRSALDLYQGILAEFAGTPEADYSRTQIQNITHSVVPGSELLAAQVAMVLAHLESDAASATETAPPGAEAP